MTIDFEALQSRHYPEFLTEEHYQEIFKKAQNEMMTKYPECQTYLDNSVMRCFVVGSFMGLVDYYECEKVKEIVPREKWPLRLMIYPVSTSEIISAGTSTI